ncbi:hypothetical protein [Brachyspira hyodysenteriae]|uniref:hypothetical protein n=1 Tax=Brachyspira hyodysenteriae TaxID=159 RepID=UPI0022CDBAB4|nr:hypothetical protein [Brachyspira hyodysenteriae]MCZ9850205.1 hypothetical protein [Brachyspira hyodysenteriae]MCZ9878175.1 hypothetical protein [Brachyspira hyodysenteriae]MCZ9889681.1 hypothetical protein [Brachyspira hyodysenteriae]MCZ9894623.1 hypothetical protein [Brachyspira hyodysenteriae]MCZ9898331.1 hypothetical protein [Brachyspira hyodysenteriae]
MSKLKEFYEGEEEQLLQGIDTEKTHPLYQEKSKLMSDIVNFLNGYIVDFYLSTKKIKHKYSDLIIAETSGNYQMLCLILQTSSNKKLSKYQIAWLKEKKEQGYAVSVAYGYFDTIYKIKKYLAGEPIIWEE